jgi:glycerophosphoryl diester phosphodiesterase
VTPGRRAAVAALVALAGAACGEGEEVREARALDPELAAPVLPGPAGLAAYLDCLSDEAVTLVAAHRGGPAPGYPENALATFAHTLSRIPALLEVDVAATRDGVLVLMHDDRLERTTTCTGVLADKTWSALRACRLEDNDGRATDFAIPTLEETLAWAEGRTVLEIDIKSSVRYEDVVAAVRRADAEERVILITYSVGGAARLAGIAPELVVSTSIYDVDDLEDHERRGVSAEQIAAWTGTTAPDDRLNAALEARGVPVLFGTLGDPERSVDGEIARTGEEGRYREIAAMGVDVIATDRPIQAYAALSEARDPRLAIEACRTLAERAS